MRLQSPWRRLCLLVLIMSVRGFARTGMRVLGGLRRRRVGVCRKARARWVPPE